MKEEMNEGRIAYLDDARGRFPSGPTSRKEGRNEEEGRKEGRKKGR